MARHAQDRPDLLERIHAECDVRGVEIVHAIRHEMAQGLDGLVLRRLGLGDVGHPGAALLNRCATLVATEFNWSVAQTEQAIAELEAWFERRRYIAGTGSR